MRLDQKLVDLGLAPSRARAQSLIAAGVVRVDGAPARKASQTAPDAAAVTLEGEDPCPYVSRGGLKLAHALTAFEVSPKGAVLADIGASTGGFTDVALRAGAQKVYAVDVGRDQLHPDLRGDPRVCALEATDARTLSAAQIPEPLDWITADLAFISLTKALPAVLRLARPGAVLVALIKPQFEAGRGAVGKGGVVKDPAAQARAAADIAAFLTAEGWAPRTPIDSPILGGDGNREFLIAAEKCMAERAMAEQRMMKTRGAE